MTYFLHIIIMICVMLFPILGYNLVFGRGKIMFFGQEVFSILATYGIFISVYQYEGYSFLIMIAPLLIVASALLFAFLALKLESDAFGILSIALHLTLLAIVLNWPELTRGALGIPQIPRFFLLDTQERFCVAIVVVSILWFGFVRFMDAGTLGRELKALAENRHHAEALGIQRFSVYLKAFLIAGIGSLLSGFFYPQYIGLLHPNDYTFQSMIPFMLASIAGGSGSVLGATIATILIMTLTEGLRFLPLSPGLVGPLRLVLFGLILLIVVFVRRHEIFPKRRTV